jgi:hypothetical protein
MASTLGKAVTGFLIVWAIVKQVDSAFGVNPGNPTIAITDNFFYTMPSGIIGGYFISHLPQLIISILYLVFLSWISRIVSARE